MKELLNNCYYIGALIAAGVTLGTSKWQSTWAWRAPSLFQAIFSIICLLFLPFIPESPRWLVARDGYEDARVVVALTNANGDLDDPVAMAVYKQIVDTLEWEKKQGRTMSPKEIFKTPTARKRVLIGASAGPFSCIAGNIIASYYLGDELKTAGIDSSNDQLKANVVLNSFCLLACLVGTQLANVWGRKPTALLSQSLLIICLFIIGGLSKMYADNKSGASQGLVYGNVAVMFLFQGFYSIAWTPLLTLYPPEVMPYATRANGNALSSFVLNGLALLLVFVMPIGLDKIGWKMYMINGSWDIIVLALIAVYWVETKGKTLEEIDALFDGGVHSTVQNVEHVRQGREILDLGKIKTDLQEERSLRTISVVGCHSEGEVGHVIVGGVLDVPGKTMYDKLEHFLTKKDDLRQLLLNEPRGRSSMKTNLVLPPCDPRADAGFLIMESDEYAPMSGSNAICTTTVLLETGMLPIKEPITRLNLDTAAGLVGVTAHCEGHVNASIKGVSIIAITEPVEEGDGCKMAKNAVVVSPGRFDRSPCGTGTCARMAVMHARGQLGIGQVFRHRSIIGTEFVNHIRGTTKVGEYDAILPTVQGRAWITSYKQIVLDPEDPFPTGFRVGDQWHVSKDP
ncbi:hypothetical protein MY1884_006123 [Beauveria asiatica]